MSSVSSAMFLFVLAVCVLRVVRVVCGVLVVGGGVAVRVVLVVLGELLHIKVVGLL